MSDKYTPLLEPIYDLSTSYTKDDAVQYFLGWLKGPIRENFLSEEEMHARYLRGENDYEPSVFEMLQANREWAEADYSDAVYEKREQGVIDNIVAKLEKCDLDIKRAHHYVCLIDDELAKGNESALRIDHKATENPSYPYITLASLDQWAEKLNITIFKPQADQKEQDGNSLEGELSLTKTASVQTILALLVEVFAKTANTFHKDHDAPNVSNIADKLLEMAVENNIKLSKSTIEKAIRAAMKVKKDNINSKL